jgi:hypothetical protein
VAVLLKGQLQKNNNKFPFLFGVRYRKGILTKGNHMKIDSKAITQKFVAEIDEAELVVRMIEAAAGVKRPVGMSAKEALNLGDKVVAEAYTRAAYAAMDYWRECISQINKVN